MAGLWRDIQVSFRVLTKNPGITAITLLSLALGIGANTAIFSLLNAILLRPLPIPHPEQIVSLETTIADQIGHKENFTWPMFVELGRQQTTFSSIFAWNGGTVSNYEVDGVHYASTLAQASATYYQGMQIIPLLGRFIGPEDFGAGKALSSAVAVISYRVWRTWFHGSATVLGHTIRVDNHPFTVIGVAPEGFSDLSLDGASEVTVPFFSPGTSTERSERIIRFQLFARLKPEVSLQQARAATQLLWPHIQKLSLPVDYAGERKARFFARKIKLESAANGVSFLRQRFSRSLQILMAIVAMVLFIACLNIANLSLAKAAARRHQSGIQAALGASVWDLLRPALIESLALSFLGSMLGLLLAYWASNLLLKMAWTGYFATAINPSPDLKVLAFTTLVAIATGILFGILPALYAARVDPVEALRQQTRSVVGGANLFGKALLIAQVALSLMLVLAALLFSRTLSALHTTDVGYRRDHLLTLVLFPQPGSHLPPNPAAYYQDLSDQVRAIPGVESVSYSELGPANQAEFFEPVSLSDAETGSQVIEDRVGPDFFHVVGMHLINGREFRWSDFGHSAAIISQNLATHLFGNQNPIGRTVSRGPHAHADPFTIVGVVNNASLWKVETFEPMAFYQMYEPGPDEDEPLMDVRTSIDPSLLKSTVEKVLESRGHHYSLRTMTVDERLDSYLTVQRLTALLSEFFGAIALLIASVGLYGLMSFHVTRRSAELGIRSALGADRRNILLLILREALLLTITGCALGLITSLIGAKFVKAILFGVSPTDPASFALALFTMLTIATAAALIPARRAAMVDPTTALRSE